MRKIIIMLMFLISTLLFSGCGSSLAGEAFASLNQSSDGKSLFIQDGKLGIGTDSPSHKLSLRG